MPIEKEPSPKKGIEQLDDQKIKDIEQAWIGAQAEKPIRDLAREEEISEEEKAILDRLAERRGEKAMQEYAAEKEKNPIEKLFSRVDKIAAEMREKGLEQDASIMEKIKDRFNRYAEALRKSKEALEEKWNKRVSLEDLQRVGGEFATSESIPVTHQIGEDGGWLYSPKGYGETWFREASHLEKYKDHYERDKARGAEVINYSFSKEGEAEFYRALGVLEEKEELIDIPTIYQKAANEEARKRGSRFDAQVNPQNYKARFPIGIRGIRLSIEKEMRRSYDGEKEERIALEFDDELREAILAEK